MIVDLLFEERLFVDQQKLLVIHNYLLIGYYFHNKSLYKLYYTQKKINTKLTYSIT
jgi:hypothetical protein